MCIRDRNNNFIGPSVAQILNLPIITEISSIHFSDNILTVTRNNAGQVEKYTSSLPILLTTDKSLNTPRYPKLPDIMKAKKKPIDSLSADELGVDTAPRLKVVKVEEPAARSAGIKVGSVAELVDKLKHEAKVI